MPLLHDALWWAEATKEFDFEEFDNAGDAEQFNRVLWAGVKGEQVPYPAHRSGTDLRQNREQLLAQWRQRAGQSGVNSGEN